MQFRLLAICPPRVEVAHSNSAAKLAYSFAFRYSLMTCCTKMQHIAACILRPPPLPPFCALVGESLACDASVSRSCFTSAPGCAAEDGELAEPEEQEEPRRARCRLSLYTYESESEAPASAAAASARCPSLSESPSLAAGVAHFLTSTVKLSPNEDYPDLLSAHALGTMVVSAIPLMVMIPAAPSAIRRSSAILGWNPGLWQAITLAY